MKKVVNCGHRGAMAYEPENTLRSFRRAAEMGADEIELDVFRSADGELVVNHGATLHTEPRGGRIRNMTMQQIRELRFHGEPIPTLQESVDLCNETGMNINIEIKTPLAVSGVVEVIRKNNLYDRCQVSCFFPWVLRRVKSLDEKINTGFLAAPIFPMRMMKKAADMGCFSINPFHKKTTAEYMKAARALGLKVYVWTVNEPADMRRMIETGVDCVMTNKPDVLTRVKKEMGVE